MNDLHQMTDEQMARLSPYSPKSHGKPQVDDRRLLSGIIFVNRNGLRGRDAPRNTVRSRRSTTAGNDRAQMGVFGRMMEGLSAQRAEPQTVMIDATYLKAHRTAFSLGEKRGLDRLIGRTMGGMNTKLHAVADANARPLSFFITAGQISDSTGAAALLVIWN